MAGSSIITDNTVNSTNSACGGAVYVGINATFSMTDGTISNNHAKNVSTPADGYGGGVFVYNFHSYADNYGTFTKSGTGSAVIYGNNASPSTLANSSSGTGQAVYVGDGDGYTMGIHDTTARATDALDSSISGISGGWE
jgi:hypothetical protein